jgi:hypothetical protein
MRDHIIASPIAATKHRLTIDAGQGARGRLAEIEGFTEDPVIRTVYLSDGPCSFDTPDGGKFWQVIHSVPRFSRQIDRSTLIGIAENKFSTARHNNTDGRLDWMRKLVIDAQKYVVRVGDPSWTYDDFRIGCVARMKHIAQTTDKDGRWLDVEFTDAQFLADVAIRGDQISTSNDKPAPIALGDFTGQAEPVDPGGASYRFGNAPHWMTPIADSGVDEVLVGGVPVGNVTYSSATGAPARVAGEVRGGILPAFGDLYAGLPPLGFGAAQVSPGDVILIAVTYDSSATVTLNLSAGAPGTLALEDTTTSTALKTDLYSYVVVTTSFSIFARCTAGSSMVLVGTVGEKGQFSTAQAVNHTNNASGPNIVAPTLNPVVTGTARVDFYVSRGTLAGLSIAPPVGQTEHSEGSIDDGTSSIGMSIASETLAGSGATGTRTAVATNHSGANAGIGIIFKSRAAISCSAATDDFTTPTANNIATGDKVAVYSTGTMPTTSPQISNANDRVEWYDAYNSTGTSFQLKRLGTLIDITNATFTGELSFVARKFMDVGDGSLALNTAATAPVVVRGRSTNVGPNGYRVSDFLRWIHYVVAKQDDDTYIGAHPSFPLADDLDGKMGLFLRDVVSGKALANRICKNAHAFITQTLEGDYTFGRVRTNPLDLAVDPDDFNTPAALFTDYDVIDGTSVIDTPFDPLYRRASVIVAPNNPPQTQFASGVDELVRAQLAAAGIRREQAIVADGNYASTPWRYHYGMTDTGDIALDLVDDPTFYNAWMDFLIAKFFPHLVLRTCTLRFSRYRTEIGKKVQTLMPLRAGDSTTLNWQIIGSDIDFTAKRVDFALIGHIAPDAITASY